MEKKDEDLIKKVAKLIEEGKKRKITDFDSGLLQESFETIEGSATEKYELWCKRLLNVATRLENIRVKKGGSLDDENYSVLKEIDEVLSKAPPSIQILGGDKRDNTIACMETINGKRRLYGQPCVCNAQAFDKTLELVKEKQHFALISRIKQLEYKAKARLDSFKWHRDDAVEDVGSAEVKI